ncbi:hypothetical protein [Crenobacter caeni]|uniref:ATP-binding protein n=1 Tax=Crenobacter caeni TaxID=2705474 RepID=A0A6B2KUM8_9NEIS|nr:hypothetical protein [Crenobacter caeni]NDV13760.1 hypothetical protein [Crenobacter caeni]
MTSLTMQFPAEHKQALWASVQHAIEDARDRANRPTVSPYFDEAGKLLFARVRIDTEHGKTIRPFHPSGGRWKQGEPAFDGKKPLLNLPLLAAHQGAEVVVVEGEKCAAVLTDAGRLATTSGGASSVNGADWTPLTGRSVIVWPDNDQPGANWLADLLPELKRIGAEVRVVDVDRLELTDGGDVADWLPLHGVEALETLPMVEAEALAPAATDADDEPANGRDSAATALVRHVQSNCVLYRNQDGDVFAKLNGSNQAWKLSSTSFRDWLSASFYRATDKAARDQAIKEALSVLTGIGRHEGELREAHIRVARHGDRYLIDLGDDAWRVVEVSADGWQIIEHSPVLFVRSKPMRPLPDPVRGGSLDALWPCVNVPKSARPLVLAWLLECLRPDTPYPLLELTGEQGSAKSTTQSYLRRLVDPNHVNLRAAPKTNEDVFVSAASGLLVSYENLSHLSPQMQDAFCTLATGGGFARRQLYTDSEEATIEVKRPIVLNGIAAVVTAQDLVSRTVSVDLPTIQARATGAELEAKFDAEHGRLFGALLDLFAATLRALPDVHLDPERRPRMADFCLLGMAMFKAQGKAPDDFARLYRQSEVGNIERTLDASPVATAVRELAEDRSVFSGTLKELLLALERYHQGRGDAWPKSERGLSAALKRAAPALRMVGISVGEDLSISRRQGRWWRVEQAPEREKFTNEPSRPSHRHGESPEDGKKRDGVTVVTVDSEKTFVEDGEKDRSQVAIADEVQV